jgi:hypothetical protein
MTVDTEGYEEAFEDVNRPNVEPASEVVKALQKKLADITTERDNLITENKIIKEKTQPSFNSSVFRSIVVNLQLL